MGKIYSLEFQSKIGKNVRIQKTNRLTIYLSYYKKDYLKASKLIERILKDNDVIIYYRDYDKYPNVDPKEANRLIGQIQTSIILVTNNYLYKEDNDAYENEFDYIFDNNIPFLPIIDDESIDLDAYSDKFGIIQYFDANQSDKTQISFDKKLKDFLVKHSLDEKDYQIASRAFDTFAFLSYRKKDRLLALDLIDDIHAHPECQDVAIWYDEFLAGGEEFEKNLIEKIGKSDAFILLVTPNLINEENYVKNKEYPLAKKELNKDIIPVEAIATDKKELKEKYEGIPSILAKDKAHREVAKLHKGKEVSTKKLYALGLAYLKGIGVEINRHLGIELLEKAANKNYAPALNKLANIYTNGEGVVKDLQKANGYLDKLIDHYKNLIDIATFNETASQYYKCLISKSNNDNYLEYRNERTITNFTEGLKFLKSFKNVDKKYENDYLSAIIGAYSSVCLSGSEKLVKEYVDPIDYLECLVKLQKNGDSFYHQYAFIYRLLVCMYFDAGTQDNKKIIEELFICLDNAFTFYPDNICKILNYGYVPISVSSRFTEEERAYIYRRFLSYYEYIKDKKERLNKSAELRVELFYVESKVHVANIAFLTNELIELEEVYERRSVNDPLLMRICYLLSGSYLQEEEKEKFFQKALKEARELPDSLFINESRHEIKDELFIKSYLKDETLSFEEKMDNIFDIYHSSVTRKNYIHAMYILTSYIVGNYLDKKDKDNIYLCNKEAKRLIELDESLYVNEFYYNFVLAFINNDVSNINNDFASWVNRIEHNEQDAFERYSSLFLSLCDIYGLLKQKDDELTKTFAYELFSLIYNYVSQNNDWIINPNLVQYYLVLFNVMLDIVKGKAKDEWHEYVATIYLKQLENASTFNELSPLLRHYSFIIVQLLTCSIGVDGLDNKTLISKMVSLLNITIEKYGLEVISDEVLRTMGVIALITATKLGEMVLWKSVSSYLNVKANAHSLTPIYYNLIINELDITIDEKAQMIKDSIIFIMETVGDENTIPVSLYRGTYMATLNILPKKDYDLLIHLHKKLLTYVEGNDNYWRFKETINTFIFFDGRLLNLDESFNNGEQRPDMTIVNLINDCVDLVETFVEYAKCLPDNDIKYYSCLCAAQSSLYIACQKDYDIRINDERLFDKVIYCLDYASKIATFSSFADLCSLFAKTFGYYDKYYQGHAPGWYMKYRVRFMAHLYNAMLYYNHYDYPVHDFNTFINLESSFDTKNDYTDCFPDTLSSLVDCLLMSGGDDEIKQLIKKIGIGYHLSHIEDIDIYAFGHMYCSFSNIGDSDFVNALTFITNIENVSKYEEMINEYQSVILFLREESHIDKALSLAFKLIEYLDKYCVDNKDQASIKECYKDTYQFISDVYEELDDNKLAYQYREIAKRY